MLGHGPGDGINSSDPAGLNAPVGHVHLFSQATGRIHLVRKVPIELHGAVSQFLAS